jgi:hypothetical protein
MQAVDRERVPAVESLKGREIAPRQAGAGQLWPLAVRSAHVIQLWLHVGHIQLWLDVGHIQLWLDVGQRSERCPCEMNRHKNSAT